MSRLVPAPSGPSPRRRPIRVAGAVIAAATVLGGCTDTPEPSTTPPPAASPAPHSTSPAPLITPSASQKTSQTPTMTLAHPDAALLRAARTDDADLARAALAQGADVDARDHDDLDRTPLIVAANHDAVQVAEVLLAAGASVDLLDDQHDTAWLVTGVTGSVAMGQVLLTADPDLTVRNRYGGLSPIPAGERGHVDYIRWVVTTDVDINHRNDLGWTALLEAIVLGDGTQPYQQIVRILLAAGADPSITDKQGRDARELAVEHGHRELVRIIDQARDQHS